MTIYKSSLKSASADSFISQISYYYILRVVDFLASAELAIDWFGLSLHLKGPIA
mgnify:CR=1 FL=1